MASESEYAIISDEERKKLNDTSISKAERIANLFDCYKRMDTSISKAERIANLFDCYKRMTDTDEYTNWLYFNQYIDELKHDFPLYMEAFATIGYAKV